MVVLKKKVQQFEGQQRRICVPKKCCEKYTTYKKWDDNIGNLYVQSYTQENNKAEHETIIWIVHEGEKTQNMHIQRL